MASTPSPSPGAEANTSSEQGKQELRPVRRHSSIRCLRPEGWFVTKSLLLHLAADSWRARMCHETYIATPSYRRMVGTQLS
eukprot:1359371-Pyramimonas_sp.AAC.2